MKIVTLTHKIRLDPTFKKKEYFCKACGTARFAWNWGLSKCEENYKAGRKTNALELKKEFNKRKELEFPWVYEVTKYACQQPFIHLQRVTFPPNFGPNKMRKISFCETAPILGPV